MSDSAASPFAKNKNVVAQRRPNGGVLLVHLNEDDFYFSIEGLAAEVWQGLESGQTPDALARALAEKHAVPETTVRKDIDRFVADLRKNKIIA